MSGSEIQIPEVPKQPQAVFHPLVIDLTLIHVNFIMFEIENGTKILRFQAPNGIAVSVPLDDTGRENLIQTLKGTKLSIARL